MKRKKDASDGKREVKIPSLGLCLCAARHNPMIYEKCSAGMGET
jgi:hypothetical protein